MPSKTVLITGCSSGIGYLSALKFARSGLKTFASVRNTQSEGANTLREITVKENLPLEVIEIDVDDTQSVKNGISYVLSKTNIIDILVNNAGYGYLGAVEDFKLEEVKRQYETNVFGALRMIKEVVPVMRLNKSGRVINISSINGLVSFPLYGIYSSSKFALETISEVLDFELSHFGIKVAIVEPGAFLTNFIKNRKIAEISKLKESVYSELVENFFERYEKKAESSEVLKASMNPQKVADTVFKVATIPNPKLRNIVGIDANIYFILRRILPYSLWKSLLRLVYKW